jgi:hypothetical protein
MFLDHEQKVYDYIVKNQVERVMIGNAVFEITKDSFMLELDDFDKLTKPC